MRGRALSIVVLVIILLLWEFFPRQGNFEVFLPKVSLILKTFFLNLGREAFLMDVFSTTGRAFIGFLIASAVMIPLGLLMGKVRFVYQLFEPFIEFFRPMPSAAIIPIAILFLGIDDEMKLFVIFFGSSWPILINTIEGVKGIEPILLKTGKVFGFSNRKMLLSIILPASMPMIIAGVRISVAISLILAITVEMIVGGNGIGYFILDAERSFNFPDMYAGVLTIGLLGIFVNYLVRLLERKTISWYKKSKKAN